MKWMPILVPDQHEQQKQNGGEVRAGFAWDVLFAHLQGENHHEEFPGRVQHQPGIPLSHHQSHGEKN